MATRDNHLFQKNDKVQANSNNNNNQYSNLNLNQNYSYKCFVLMPSQSDSKLTFGKKSVIPALTEQTFVENTQGNRSSSNNLYSKSVDSYGKDKEEKAVHKHWIKSKSSNTINSSSSSTLSLHITAYENSVAEVSTTTTSNSSSSIISKTTVCTNSLKRRIQNPFDSPRQMEDNTATDSEPEVMQFKASQKLIFPGQGIPLHKRKIQPRPFQPQKQQPRGNGTVATISPPQQQPKPPQLQDNEDHDNGVQLSTASIFVECFPRKVRTGGPHPHTIVETAAMNAVEPPDVKLTLRIPENWIDSGALSCVQMEAIIYACQSHEQRLPNGWRRGFLIGDGAGVGKGRTISGIIVHNYESGRRRSIWLSNHL